MPGLKLPGNMSTPREGEVLRLTELAKTLQRVADEGADALYTGTIADEIIKLVRKHVYYPRSRRGMQGLHIWVYLYVYPDAYLKNYCSDLLIFLHDKYYARVAVLL